MNPQEKYEPRGNATDYFDKDAIGPTRAAMFNMAYMKDQAVKRNKIYLALIAILIVAMVVLALTANYKTYVVRVDSTTGKIDGGQELKALPYSPQEAELKYFLTEFIRGTRTVPIDLVLYNQNWNRMQHFMTPEAATKYSTLMKKENFFANIGENTVQPNILTIQSQPNLQNTYQIRWDEDVYNQGVLNGRKKVYMGLFTIKIVPPEDEKELAINPLGILIADLSYAVETEVSSR